MPPSTQNLPARIEWDPENTRTRHVLLLANTDGPPHRLFACQPSTPDTAAQGQAGWGRRGAIVQEFMIWCITTKTLRMKIINVPVILAEAVRQFHSNSANINTVIFEGTRCCQFNISLVCTLIYCFSWFILPPWMTVAIHGLLPLKTMVSTLALFFSFSIVLVINRMQMLAAIVVPLGKALYSHCVIPQKIPQNGLKTIGPLVACL